MGWATGLCPWGNRTAFQEVISTDGVGTAGPDRKVFVGAAGSAMQGNIHRWVGTAPTYLEPGLASILPLKRVCSQLLVEWAGGRG